MDETYDPGFPKQIGPYRIVAELGSGGMGGVYLAEQTEPFQRQVALKDHPEMAYCLSSLAGLYASQGRATEAER